MKLRTITSQFLAAISSFPWTRSAIQHMYFKINETISKKKKKIETKDIFLKEVENARLVTDSFRKKTNHWR